MRIAELMLVATMPAVASMSPVATLLPVASALPSGMALPVARAAAAAPRIRLCEGLTIVTAISEPAGDYETIKTIQSAGAGGIGVHVSAQRRVQGVVRNFMIQRTVLPADLKSATLYLHNFMPRAPITIPGSTALGTSSGVLRALKTTGTAEIGLVDASNSALSADSHRHPNIFDFRVPYRLTRSSSGGVATMPVLLDGTRVELPVVRAQGVALAGRAEFVFLDDEDNPLTLALRIGSEAPADAAAGGDALRLQVVRISSRCATSSASAPDSSPIERALIDSGRVDVYDLFFDFASDRLREESDATLREIAALLRRHPAWTLSIAGHTDGIASDTYNLDLSRRRAAAVKDALVTAHGIAATRLSTTGYGKSRPRDTNDTLEGRAHNRRVELVRQ